MTIFTATAISGLFAMLISRSTGQMIGWFMVVISATFFMERFGSLFIREYVRKSGFAYRFASKAHMGQKRKYTKEPYINHPVEVYKMMSTITSDEDVLAAALLHDTVEDCGVNLDEIRALFGIRVANIVDDLTDKFQSKDDSRNRSARKADECKRMAAISIEAATIKYCDLICNTKSIVQHDHGFARTYIPEKRAILNVMNQGDLRLLIRAQESLLESETKLKNNECCGSGKCGCD